MIKLTIGKQQYKYLVGGNKVAIITPSRKKHIVLMREVEGDPSTRVANGTSDVRMSPEEVAAYIIREKIA